MIKYCCTYKSKQSVYRHYDNDRQAVMGFQRYAIRHNDTIADLSKKLKDGTWSRVAIRREWLF